jgi:hypothetical protein
MQNRDKAGIEETLSSIKELKSLTQEQLQSRFKGEMTDYMRSLLTNETSAPITAVPQGKNRN